MELGEHLYNGRLQLRDVTDVFGRPARHWEYDGKVIGDYAKEELLVKDYVGKVTGSLPKKYLQAYLDEFCFRFSRRDFGPRLLQRLALAVGSSARLS